ncbi:MAG TPA: hypothetical protein VEJ67_12475 [Candidatus Cybelea sp.]|nr:hypothetical protein [Candidatus Cybelea sp.]
MQRRLAWVMLLTVVAVVTALSHTRKVHAKQIQDHNHVCSAASLKGTYAWHRTGVNNVVGGPIAEIGIAFYGGDGTRGAIRNTRSTNGEIRPWTDQPAPNGSYTVDPDCTGSFFDEDGTHSNDVVVLDGGKRYLVLNEAAGTIVSEEGTRIDPED